MQFFNVTPAWLVPLALFLVALLVGTLMVRSVREGLSGDEAPASDRERLNELERAHAAGELNAEELRAIRKLLSGPERAKALEPVRRRPPIEPDPTPAAGDESSPADEPPVGPDSP